MRMPPEQIARLLREQAGVPEEAFDEWLPEREKLASHNFWTSVRVASLAARLLEDSGARRVLDVGAGAGKFCVVGALATDLNFVGIEHRAHLVAVSQELAQRFGVERRVDFVLGEFGAAPLPDVDALYFYNPFEEAEFPVRYHFDRTVEIGKQRSMKDVATSEQVLRDLAVGSHVVTYNGFGGRLPDTFELVHSEPAGVDLLRLWCKSRARGNGCHWLELGRETILRNVASGRVIQVVGPRGTWPLGGSFQPR